MSEQQIAMVILGSPTVIAYSWFDHCSIKNKAQDIQNILLYLHY